MLLEIAILKPFSVPAQGEWFLSLSTGFRLPSHFLFGFEGTSRFLTLVQIQFLCS